jgi:hypothetical protein
MDASEARKPEGGRSMANEPVDMIMPMLREMRAEMGEHFSQIDRRIDQMQSSLVLVQDELNNVRKALIADTLMSRLVSGDFDSRIAALEIDVEELMKGT